MSKPYVEMKEPRRLGIKNALLILLVLTTLLFSVLYATTKDDSFVIKHMGNWLLQGAAKDIKVNDLLFQYNGTETSLSGGSLQYTKKVADIKSYSYRVLLEEVNGKKEPIILQTSNVFMEMASLPAEISMGSITGTAENIRYKNLAEKYKAKLEFTLVTKTETIEEEIYLKITELNTEFFRK